MGAYSRGFDLSGLLPVVQKLNDEAVLNGIAYDAEHDRLFVTGKQWPTIFEIKLVKPRSGPCATGDKPGC